MKMLMVTNCMINCLYQNKTFSLVRVFFYISIPVFIMMQPAQFMDSYSLCLIYHLFHVQCFMCGMTRAFVHLLHFDLNTAIQWNPFSPYLFVVIVIIVIMDCYFIWKTRKNID